MIYDGLKNLTPKGLRLHAQNITEVTVVASRTSDAIALSNLKDGSLCCNAVVFSDGDVMSSFDLDHRQTTYKRNIQNQFKRQCSDDMKRMLRNIEKSLPQFYSFDIVLVGFDFSFGFSDQQMLGFKTLLERLKRNHPYLESRFFGLEVRSLREEILIQEKSESLLSEMAPQLKDEFLDQRENNHKKAKPWLSHLWLNLQDWQQLSRNLDRNKS